MTANSDERPRRSPAGQRADVADGRGAAGARRGGRSRPSRSARRRARRRRGSRRRARARRAPRCRAARARAALLGGETLDVERPARAEVERALQLRRLGGRADDPDVDALGPRRVEGRQVERGEGEDEHEAAEDEAADGPRGAHALAPSAARSRRPARSRPQAAAHDLVREALDVVWRRPAHGGIAEQASPPACRLAAPALPQPNGPACSSLAPAASTTKTSGASRREERAAGGGRGLAGDCGSRRAAARVRACGEGRKPEPGVPRPVGGAAVAVEVAQQAERSTL